MQPLKRESTYKTLFLLRDGIAGIFSAAQSLAGFCSALATVGFFCLIIFDFGFRKTAIDADVIERTYLILLSILFTAKFLIELLTFRKAKWFAVTFRILVLLLVFITLLVHADCLPATFSAINSALSGRQALIFASLALIITQIHHISTYVNRINVSAYFLFAGSFVAMILIGSLLLMLPNATVQPLSFYQAFFTAASAICVTGMSIVDPTAVFSPMGKGILLVLIQIGGLGIMTFTGFFSYIFLGSASFKDRFLLKDFFSGEHLEGLYKLLLKILLFTLLVEAVGAVVIYQILEGDWIHKTHSAVFHSISAFCNAGISVYPQGPHASYLHSNYPLQLVICGLVILGGIGFPILLHIYKDLKSKINSLLHWFAGKRKSQEVLALAVGERLALNTTIVLLLAGAVLYYVFETSGPLTDPFRLPEGIMAFVASVNARTSGFNMVDMTQWSHPTLFLTMFLMWVGASPGSTGGGIKTTTLAVAVKTVFNFLRGKRRLEICNREIGASTIIRVLAIIVLSLAFILISFMLLMIFEPTRNPVHLLYECVAAFSTTGLSIANTATLGTPSQVVLLILMFAGRIGPVVLLSGLLLTETNDVYRLPVTDIEIN